MPDFVSLPEFEAMKRKLVTSEPGRHQQAVLYHERARAAEAAGKEADALGLAAKALDLAPDFPQAAVLRSHLEPVTVLTEPAVNRR